MLLVLMLVAMPVVARAQATPTPNIPCCEGDCNGDGKVSIDELMAIEPKICLAIVGGCSPSCPAGDCRGDNFSDLTDLVEAVNNAIGGCPAPPVPTPTPLGWCGDCGDTGPEPVNDAIVLVRIALGEDDRSACGNLPPDVAVDIALVIRIVNNELSGCPGQ